MSPEQRQYEIIASSYDRDIQVLLEDVAKESFYKAISCTPGVKLLEEVNRVKNNHQQDPKLQKPLVILDIHPEPRDPWHPHIARSSAAEIKEMGVPMIIVTSLNRDDQLAALRQITLWVLVGEEHDLVKIIDPVRLMDMVHSIEDPSYYKVPFTSLVTALSAIQKEKLSPVAKSYQRCFQISEWRPVTRFSA